jgi:hypothetical protein
LFFLYIDFGSANKSAHSLTHITFTGPVFHYLGSSFDTFLNLRFPNLKSLELGTLAAFSGSVPYATTIASVTRFIVEHNTIEHLSLSKRVPRDPDGVFFHLDGNLITADILPNLRSFEGCPAALTILARRGVTSVFSLASLSLFAFEENLNDLSAVVGTIKSSPAKALTSVRNLRVEFFSIIIPPVMAEGVQEGVHAMSSNATSMRERHCLDDIAGVCPNVVNYSGTFPAMCAVSPSK